MSACDRFELEAAAFAGGTLDADGEARMRAHARSCPECRRRLAEVEELLAGAAAVRGDIDSVMDTIDWEALPGTIAARIFDEPSRQPLFERLSDVMSGWGAPRWRPVLGAALAGLIIGAGGMFFALRPRAVPAGDRAGYFASSDVIDRMEYQMARQETLDYLDRSQTLLLEFAQNGAAGPIPLSRADTVEKARALVEKKRYLNTQLESIPLAKARAICDQIELLFIELGRSGEDLTPAEAAEIRDYIERKQLLLKIKLLRSELTGSEV